MMESFFFIPAGTPKYLAKRTEIQVSHIVFDLEDSITKDDVLKAVNNLNKIEVNENYLIRIPNSQFIASGEFKNLINKGYRRFIIPKVFSKSELEPIKEFSRDLQLSLILLIENPMILINLKDVLCDFNNYIEGIGLGSHDYSSYLDMIHSEENLKFAKDLIFTTGNAFGIKVIDVASMEIEDEDKLKKEIYNAYRAGYRAKFFIHPKQLEVLKEVSFFNNEEIQFAYLVLKMIGELEDFKPIKINGTVIEKPHLKKYKNIIQWHEESRRK